MIEFTWKKNLLFLLGLISLGTTVTLIQQSNLGMSAWDALNRNFYEGLHVPYRILNVVVALVLISIAYTLERKHFLSKEWAAYFGVFFIGVAVITEFKTMWNLILTINPLWLQVMTFGLMFLFIFIYAYFFIKLTRSLWIHHQLVILYFFPLLVSFIVGLVIDLLLLVIPSVVEESLWINLLYVLLATLICGVGLNFIIHCHYPLPSLDELCRGISQKFSITFGKGKLIGEGIALILTIIVGLIFQSWKEYFYIGPTTILFGLGIGYVVDFLHKPISKLINWVIK